MKARLSLLLVLAAAAFSPLIEGGTTHTPVLVLKFIVIALMAVKLTGPRDNGSLLFVRSPLDAAVLLISAAAIYSAIIAPYKYMALVWGQLIVFYVLFYYLARAAIREAGDNRLTVTAVLIMGAVQTAVSIYQWFSGAARVKGTFFNPNMAAGYIAVTVLLALSLLAHGKSRIRKGFYVYLLGLYIAAGIAAILLSGSRGAIVSLVAGLFVIVWFRSRVFAVACALALAAAVVVIPNPVRERALSKEPFAYSREGIWNASVRMAKDHPLGVGLGNYKYLYGRYAFPVEAAVVKYGKKANTAHNEYLHFTVEMGLPGLVAILFGLFVLARAMLSSARCPADEEAFPVGVWALGGLTAFSVHALVDSNFHEPGLVFLFILMVCMGLEAGDPNRTQAREVRLPSGSGGRPAALVMVLALLLAVWVIKPEVARYYQEAGVESLKKKDLVSALTMESRAVSIEPGDASSHEDLASAMYALYTENGDESRLNGSLDELARAEALNPNNPKYPEVEAYLLESAAMKTQDQAERRQLLEAALVSLGRALAADPYSAVLLFRKAAVCSELGYKVQAEETLKHIIDIEPNFLRARYALAVIYKETGRKRLSLDECYSIIKSRDRLAGMRLDPYEQGFVSVDMDAVRSLITGLEA